MTMHTSAQKAALLLAALLVVGLAATAVANEVWSDSPPAPTVADHGAPMTPEEQCAHMPEHCAGGGARGG